MSVGCIQWFHKWKADHASTLSLPFLAPATLVLSKIPVQRELCCMGQRCNREYCLKSGRTVHQSNSPDPSAQFQASSSSHCIVCNTDPLSERGNSPEVSQGEGEKRKMNCTSPFSLALQLDISIRLNTKAIPFPPTKSISFILKLKRGCLFNKTKYDIYLH